jgi:hypothetical protein
MGEAAFKKAQAWASDQLSGRASIDFQPAGSPNFIPQGPTHFTGSRIKVLAP